MVGEEHTFRFADHAGYTALTEVHGDVAADDAVSNFVTGVRGLLGRWAC